MRVLQLVVLTGFLLTGIFCVLKPLNAANITVNGLKRLMRLLGFTGDIIPTPRAVSFLQWWNVLMLGVTIVTLRHVAMPGD